LLERVGFIDAPRELYAAHSVEGDEALMVRRMEQP
jgi:hypothetical protein